jgi:hypothetical protein
VTLVNSIRSPSRGEEAAMLGDLGIDQLVADGAQLRERPRLIGFHETRVTYHVRRNDYCEPSQEHVLCHHPPPRGEQYYAKILDCDDEILGKTQEGRPCGAPSAN